MGGQVVEEVTLGEAVVSSGLASRRIGCHSEVRKGKDIDCLGSRTGRIAI